MNICIHDGRTTGKLSNVTRMNVLEEWIVRMDDDIHNSIHELDISGLMLEKKIDSGIHLRS